MLRIKTKIFTQLNISRSIAKRQQNYINIKIKLKIFITYYRLQPAHPHHPAQIRAVTLPLMSCNRH